MLRNAYGERLAEADAQIERNALSPAKPPLRIWQGCGEQDALKETVLQSKAFLEKIPDIDYQFSLLPGSHDWALWDEMLRRFISTLPLQKPEVMLL